MRVMRAGAAVMLAALAAGAVTAAPRNLKFNMTTVSDAAGMHVNVEAKVWVKGDKARVETNDPRGGPMIVLVDGPQIRRLYPQQKQGFVNTLAGGKGGPINAWQLMIADVGELTRGAKKLGEERLDGYACDVYLLTHRSPTEAVTVKSWITRATQPRLPLKVEESSHVHSPHMTMDRARTVRITGLKIGLPLPDSLFVMPAGYKLVQAGRMGMPGLPAGPGRRPPGPRP